MHRPQLQKKARRPRVPRGQWEHDRHEFWTPRTGKGTRNETSPSAAPRTHGQRKRQTRKKPTQAGEPFGRRFRDETLAKFSASRYGQGDTRLVTTHRNCSKESDTGQRKETRKRQEKEGVKRKSRRTERASRGWLRTRRAVQPTVERVHDTETHHTHAPTAPHTLSCDDPFPTRNSHFFFGSSSPPSPVSVVFFEGRHCLRPGGTFLRKALSAHADQFWYLWSQLDWRPRADAVPGGWARFQLLRSRGPTPNPPGRALRLQ